MRPSIRRLRFNSLIALTLAAGVGTSAAMFAVTRIFLWADPPAVPSASGLVVVKRASLFRDFVRIRNTSQTIEVAAYRLSRASLDAGSGTRQLAIECISDTYFGVLGTEIRIGRAIGGSGSPGSAAPETVLSNRFWHRAFGADLSAIGRLASVNGRFVRIVGVAPPGFQGLGARPVDAWMLLTAAPEICTLHGSLEVGANVTVVGRIKSGATLEGAASELDVLMPRVPSASGPWLISVREEQLPYLRRDIRNAKWAAGGAAMLLLMAWANVAGLLLLQANRRRSEMAVRVQLGARTRQLTLMLLQEQIPVVVGCVLLACGVTSAIMSVLRAFVPFADDWLVLDAPVLGVLISLTVIVAMLSAIAPAIRYGRVSVAHDLRAANQAFTTTSRSSHFVLAAQGAMAFTLIAAAGLMAQSLANLTGTAGYNMDRLLVANVDFSGAGYVAEQDIQELHAAMRERVLRVPGVASAALSSGDLLPATVDSSVTALQVEPGRFAPAVMALPMPSVQGVSPEYFSTAGTALRRGRSFMVGDTRTSAPVMIVDQSLAEANWPDTDPVGRCAYLIGVAECIRVVGVAEPRRTVFLEQRTSEVFLPLAQAGRFRAAWAVPRGLLIRVDRALPDLISEIASVLRATASGFQFTVEPVADRADQRSRSWHLAAVLFGWCAAAAIVMAAVGLFSTFAFRIQTRTRDIALRRALGASPRQAITPIVAGDLRTLAIGILCGLTVVGLSARFLRALLFEVTPLEPTNLMSAAATLLLSAALGLVVPMARAIRIDAARALRDT
jgi:predicted permease